MKIKQRVESKTQESAVLGGVFIRAENQPHGTPLSHKFIHETFVVEMAVKVVNMSYIAARLSSNLSGLRDGVDGRTTDDTTGDWELGAGSAEESVHFTGTLATFVDTPRIMLVYHTAI